MGRYKVQEEKALKYEVKTRVTAATYERLQAILQHAPNLEMSSLIREILDNRKIKVFTYDHSLDKVMEELAALRGEIKAIGVNINQITRSFNTYPEQRRKEFYAKIALQTYTGLDPKIDQILNIITQLSKKWLLE